MNNQIIKNRAFSTNPIKSIKKKKKTFINQYILFLKKKKSFKRNVTKFN